MPKTRPPSPIRVGMRADELRKMRGRSKSDLIAGPQWLEPRQSAVWHYQDCSVVLERTTEDGPYRVKEVVEGDGDRAYDKPENGV